MKIYVILLTIFLFPFDILLLKFFLLKIFFNQNHNGGDSIIFINLFGNSFREPSLAVIVLSLLGIICVHIIFLYYTRLIIK